MTENIKNVIGMAFVLTVIMLVIWLTGEHYKQRIAEIQLETAKAVSNELTLMQSQLEQEIKQRKQAEVNHDKAQITIAGLHDQLDKLQINGICGNTLPESGISSTSPDGTSGLLSARVDEEFARLQKRTSELINRCDQLNIDAVRLNSSLGLK